MKGVNVYVAYGYYDYFVVGSTNSVQHVWNVHPMSQSEILWNADKIIDPIAVWKIKRIANINGTER